MPNILKPAALAVLLCVPAGAALAASASFDFTFRDGGTDTIVGTGSMSFDDPGDGSGDLADLQNVTASFVFGETSFDLGDSSSQDFTADTYEISTNQGVRTLLIDAFFDRPVMTVLSTGGIATTGRVTLEMSFGLAFTFTEQNRVGQEIVAFDGDYLATAVADTGPSVIPLPATLPLLAAGLGGLVLLRRRVGAD